jgi:hypothetical protein
MSPADATDDRAERPRICFLAVEVPPTVAEGIAGWVRPLLDAAARAVEPDRFHVTLVYYGAVAADALGELTAEIAAHASGGRLGLEPGPPGRFGRGRVLWVGLGGDVDRLAALRRELHDATGGFGEASAEPGEGPEAEYVPLPRGTAGVGRLGALRRRPSHPLRDRRRPAPRARRVPLGRRGPRSERGGGVAASTPGGGADQPPSAPASSGSARPSTNPRRCARRNRPSPGNVTLRTASTRIHGGSIDAS